MQPLSNEWPDTAVARGTKFFAQSLRSFLDQSSFEGFRAYALDTLSRMKEASLLASDIMKKRTSAIALRPVLDELLWSVEADEAAELCFPELITILKKVSRGQTVDPAQITHIADLAVYKIYPDYRAALRDWVLRLISDDKKRIELFRATGFLVSHLANDGHSRLFLIDAIELRFFERDVKRAGPSIVAGFIDSISQGRREYRVIGAVNAATANVLEHVGGWQISEIAGLPDHAREAAEGWDDIAPKQRFVTISVDAADPYRAGEELASRLSRVKSQLIIGTQRNVVSWLPRNYVYTPRAKQGVDLIDIDETLLLPSSNNPKGARVRELSKIVKLIRDNFEPASKERFSSAISTAAVAFESTVDETRLISLWSATEVLLGDPPEESARIKYFVQHIVPCICLRYHRRIFAAVHEQLAIGYRKKYTKILKDITCDWSANPHTKLVRLMCLPEYDRSREELYNLCGDNPLALHRIFRLQKLYGSPRDCLKSVRDHYTRVEWQVHRIYRARNDLVHLGRSPSHLNSLVQNASDYFRMAIISLSKRSTHSKPPAELNRLIAEIGLEWLVQLNRLETKSAAPFDERLIRSTFAAL